MKTKRFLLAILSFCVLSLCIAQTPVAYYPFSGNANDAVGTNHGTVNGATLTTDRFGNANSAYSFDGVNDAISFTTIPMSNIDNFTLMAWVNPALFDPNNQFNKMIISLGPGNNGYNLGMGNGSGSGSGNQLSALYNFVSWINSGSFFSTVNTWYHVVLVRENGITKFYFNGVQSPNTSTATPNQMTSNFQIGGQSFDPTHYWNGKIDEVKIFNTALTPAQVLAEFNANTPSANYANQFGNRVIMNGANDHIDLGNSFTQQNFTVEMWLKPGATQQTYADIIDNNHSDFQNWVVQQNVNSLNTYDFYCAKSNRGNAVRFQLSSNIWQHLALVKSASALEVYLNGALVATTPWTGNINYSSQFLRLGRWSGGGRQWNGSMDEVRFWDHARSITEIQTSMNSQLTGNETGLVGYWNMNRSGQGAGLTVDNIATATGAALNGTTFGTPTTPIFESNGCLPTRKTIQIVGCGSVTVNGIRYNTSGMYTQTLTNAAGCDSILTINAHTSSSIVLRSGNQNSNGDDSLNTLLVGPDDSEFPAPFTPAQFAAARAGGNAKVIPNHPAWIPTLPADPLAKWINNTGSNGSGNTSLIAYDFYIDQPISVGQLTFNYSVDNGLGGSISQGLFLNGQPLSGNTTGGTYSSQFVITRNDIAPLLQQGLNTLYINSVDLGSPGAIIFSANLSFSDVLPLFDPVAPICAGGTAPVLPTTSNNGITGTWSPTPVSNTTSGTYTFTPNGGQCASITTLDVTVNPSPDKPTISANGPASFCSGGSVTLTSSALTGNTWSTGETTQSITANAAGNYTVTIAATASCPAVTSNPFEVIVLPNLPYFTDGDGDGFGTGIAQLFCINPGVGWATVDGDCDDTNENIKPTTIWYKDADNDGYSNGATLTQCTQPANYKLATNLTAISGDCNDNNANIFPGAQTLTFSGNQGFTTSFVDPESGSPYTSFTFEVKYTDPANQMPPNGYPRVLLDFEGNGIFNNANDKLLVLNPTDVGDNITSNGKIYRGSINQLAPGNNWQSRIIVVDGTCSTSTTINNYPIVKVLPDIEIYANDIQFSTPNPGVSSPLTVSATIHNVSDFDAQNFVVKLINQFDPSINYGTITVDNIDARSSRQISWNITTPSIPAWCPMQVIIDQTNVIDETNELNNTALRPFTNGEYDVPGVIVVNATASPSVSYPAPGSTVTISGHAYYDEIAVPLLDPSVAGAEVTFTVTETGQTFTGVTNSSGNFSITFIKPLVPRLYNITGSITDFTLTGDFATEFSILCLPDVTPSITLSANQIIEGQSINAQFKVSNIGCLPSPPTQLHISQTGGTPAIPNISVPALAPDEIFTSPTMPLLFANSGQYSITAIADGAQIVSEQNEGNNATSVYINVLPPLPDLMPFYGPYAGPYELCKSPTNTGFVLHNSGGIASGPFTTTVKVVLNGDILATFNHPVPNITAQGYYSFNIPYTFTNLGVHHFEVSVDVPFPNGVVTESSENNNFADYPVSIVPCTPPTPPNLILVAESCVRFTTLNPIDPAFPGTMVLTSRVNNAGELPATGPIKVRFTISNGDSYIGTYNGGLAPGETVSISVTVPTVPPATATLVTKVDPLNELAESNEDDNLGPVESLCVNFTPLVYCGNAFGAGNYFVNQGIQPNIEVSVGGLYYVSSVKVRFEVRGPGISGTLNLGDGTILNPRPTCYPYCYPRAILPSTFVFTENGDYTFTMTVDPDKEYIECDELDNVIEQTVRVSNKPDMRILSQYINPSLLNPDINEPVTLLVTYENIGTNNVDDRMKMKVLVDEVEISTVSNITGLVNGDKATVSIPVPWSSSIVGVHIIRAIIDSDENVSESSETNNEATRAIIVGPAANFRFLVFEPSKSFPVVGEAITLNATIENNGLESANSEVVFMYIDNNGQEVIIGTIPISLVAGGSRDIQLPWFVTQVPARLVARIQNSTVLETTLEDNVAINEIGQISIVVTATPACENQASGTLTAAVSGGKAPYTYEWSNGASDAQITAVPGTYQVTVTDDDGRTATGEGVIENRNALVYYPDADGDGYGNNADTIMRCDGVPVGYVNNKTDCNDGDKNINPDAIEICDGIDNNCDGTVDEGFTNTDNDGTKDCVDTDDDNDGTLDINDCAPLDATKWRIGLFFVDADGDNYGTGTAVSLCYGAATPAGYSTTDSDCNDADVSVNPGATEICGNGKDDDCNPATSDVCTLPDADGDGVPDVDDCAPNNPSLYRTATFYIDSDDDGFDAGQEEGVCYGESVPRGYRETTLGTDCDDEDDHITIVQTWYKDTDDDGYSNGISLMQCARPSGYKLAGELTSNTEDCNDNNAAIKPGAPEICDGIDNNCDGLIDEGSTDTDNDGTKDCADTDDDNDGILDGDDCAPLDATKWRTGLFFVDADSDNYGTGTAVSLCYGASTPAGYSIAGGDCNDNNAAVNPGATEVCNGIDDDCDGMVDEGFDANSNGIPDCGIVNVIVEDEFTYFAPGEPGVAGAHVVISNINTMVVYADGFTNAAGRLSASGIPSGTHKISVSEPNHSSYTGSFLLNEGGTLDIRVFIARQAGQDSDNDGYFTPYDCNDANPLINPGATEICNGMDDDCDGLIDEECTALTTWYPDRDKDNFGDLRYPITSATKPAGYVANSLDCKDWDATINPSAPELCDGIDNNCNGQVDEGCPDLRTWYLDKDGDTYGNPDPRYTKQSAVKPIGYVDNALDCKDWDATINPGATELCDGIDNNCNGQVDEGCPDRRTWYIDRDGDTYGNPDPRYTKQSAVKPNGYVDNALDCIDWNATINPAATELCDGIDNNCNGQVDEGCADLRTWYLDKDGDTFGNPDPAYTKQSAVKPKGYVDNAIDCIDWDATIYPGATEICDGKDNDCNGKIDDNCVPPVITQNNKPEITAKILAKVHEPVLEVSLWPNPARDVLLVSLDAFEPHKKLEMVLMQADGKPLSVQSLIPSIKGQQVRFNVRAMAAGYYLLQVKQGGLSKSKRVIIAR